MFEVLSSDSGKIVEIKIKGKLTHDDYVGLIPELEKAIQREGKINVLFEFDQWEGIEAKAIWNDMSFWVKHRNNIEKLAMVGDKKWQKWTSDISRPFTKSEVRFYYKEQGQKARQWLRVKKTVTV